LRFDRGAARPQAWRNRKWLLQSPEELALEKKVIAAIFENDSALKKRRAKSDMSAGCGS